MHSNRLASALALGCALASVNCGGPGGGGSVAPEAALAMRAPTVTEATFIRSDSVDVNLDMGMMGSVDMPMTMNATFNLRFLPGSGNVRAVAAVESFSATIKVPMVGDTELDEAAVSGEMVFSVAPDGRISVEEPFDIKAAEAAQLLGSSSVMNDLFPGLPARAVNPGDTWIDTIQVTDSTESTTSVSETIWNYTLQGDTVVDGAHLLVISGQGTTEVSGNGQQSGFEVSQDMTGTLNGTFLWDPAVSLLHSAATATDMTGVMSVDAAGGQEFTMVLSARGLVRRASDR